LIRFHQFVGSLTHYSMTSQHLAPGRLRLPAPPTDRELLVDKFIKAASAPPLPARR
jgi:hypothetical protein